MYKKNVATKTSIRRNKSYEGERIEQKIERILNSKEPITDGAPQIFTDRKDGVRPEHDIRTDRFEIAIDAMDKVTKTWQAKREERIKAREDAKIVNMKKDETKGGDGTSVNTSDNK